MHSHGLKERLSFHFLKKSSCYFTISCVGSNGRRGCHLLRRPVPPPPPLPQALPAVHAAVGGLRGVRERGVELAVAGEAGEALAVEHQLGGGGQSHALKVKHNALGKEQLFLLFNYVELLLYHNQSQWATVPHFTENLT